MAPAMVIGMYGGISLACAMHGRGLTHADCRGNRRRLFGALIVLGIQLYDRALQGAV